MIDLQNLKLLAQLVDNLDKATTKLEKSYNDNDSLVFNDAKKEISDIQNKIAQLSKS
jgi:hypothetical protein